MAALTGMTTRRGGIAAALAVVWIVWGSTYIAMRVAVRTLPPMMMTGARFAIAGLAIYAWCWWRRRRHPEAGWRHGNAREWRASAILGLLLPAAGTGGATWAEQKLPAGTVALLLASIPVWLIAASRVAGLERVTRRAALGLLLGLVGVAVLVNPFSGGAPNLTASAVALGGAVCWGCGSAYAKRAPHPDQPLLGSSMQLICAGAALCIAGAASGDLTRIDAKTLTSTGALALTYLIIFGSLLAYSCYEWLVRHVPSQLAGTYAFINPVVALLLGWWLLGEHIGGQTLLAAAVIVTGVALMVMNGRPPQRRPANSPSATAAAGYQTAVRAGRSPSSGQASTRPSRC